MEELLQFFQQGLQVGDSLADSLSFMLGQTKTMHESQGGVMGFLCVLDFSLPYAGAA